MNLAHLHLMLIHFPIAGSFFGIPLLAWALWRRAELGATAAAAAVVLAAGIAGGLALNTGDGAEEVVEDQPGVTEAAIHEHEERAEVAATLGGLTALLGVAALGAAAMSKGRIAQGALGAALVAEIATAGAMAWTGNAAGAIRHPEASAAVVASAERGERGEQGEDDDD